jgi:hypothetical protein
MYAIVYKNRVVLGPMGWSQRYFTNALKIRHRITANIPGKPPSQMPYRIDNDTAIHDVIENKPEFDIMTQGIEGPYWDVSSDTIIANYVVKDQPIESVRNNLRKIAAGERYKKEISGVKVEVRSMFVTCDTSREGRHIFIQKLLLMNTGDTVNWKFPEGWLILSKNELAMIVSAGAAHIQAAFDWENSINDLINQATTINALNAIEIVETPPQNDEEELEE